MSAAIFNAKIASQTVPFRGSSYVSVPTTSVTIPQGQCLADARYSLNVSGGVSGGFGVQVIGFIGGISYVLAGLTNITATGQYILYPVGYSSSGSMVQVGSAANVMDIHRLDQSVPPALVLFQGGTATAGISATCTVSAALRYE